MPVAPSLRCLALVVSIAGSLPASAVAGTLAVPESFPTIQQAIDAASEGDRIEVGDGVYTEALLIERRALLDLVAVGSAAIDASGLETGILIRKSAGIRIKGFKISGALEDGIRVAGSSGVILVGNRIDGVGDDGIELDQTLDGTPTRRVRVDRNRLLRCGSHGIEVDADRVSLEDNRIRRSGSDGIEINGGRHQEVQRNRVTLSGDDGIEVQTDGVLLRKNRVSGTDASGIRLDGNRNTLIRNAVIDVDRCAVDDQGRANFLTGNRLEDGQRLFCRPRNNDD